MITKPVNEINLGDIKTLLEENVRENRELEYKEKLLINSDKDKKEFLADVSSFANSSGGYIIYGIKEKNGIPIKITGIENLNVDELILKIESQIRTSISPKIKINTKVLNYENKYLVIINISKSWIRPHRVIYKGHDKFYSRNSAGKYPLDVDELRSVFIESNEIGNKINNFINNRNDDILNNNAQLPMHNSGKIVFFVIPFESFNPENIIQATILKKTDIVPIYTRGWNDQINLDGYMTYSKDKDEKAFSYVQIYRNGIIESVSGSILMSVIDDEQKIPSIAYEKEIIKAYNNYIKTIQQLKISAPIAICLSFINIKNYRFGIDRSRFMSFEDVIYKKHILKTPIQIINNLEEDGYKVLKNSFDVVWNAFGFERSFNYNADGNWIGK